MSNEYVVSSKLRQTIENRMVDTSWEDINKVVRALFTSLVTIEEWLPEVQDRYLNRLYTLGAINDLDITIDEFIEFMKNELQ